MGFHGIGTVDYQGSERASFYHRGYYRRWSCEISPGPMPKAIMLK